MTESKPDPSSQSPKIMPETAALSEFCERYGVREVSLFGSVLRDDFDEHSNVDVMLEFKPGAGFTFDNTPDIIDDLTEMFGRRVDVIEGRCIRNPYRREAIMNSRRVIYAA